MIEFLLRKYHDLTVFYQMSLKEFIKFFKVAKEQDSKERHYLAWCVCLPHMTKDTYISFSDYHDQLSGKNIDTRPTEEIMAEVEEIRRKFNGTVTV